jgi:hypothetical protein
VFGASVRTGVLASSKNEILVFVDRSNPIKLNIVTDPLVRTRAETIPPVHGAPSTKALIVPLPGPGVVETGVAGVAVVGELPLHALVNRMATNSKRMYFIGRMLPL